MSNRGCGILLHLTSLPESQGIADFSEDCYKFIDFLVLAGVKYWQVLPLGPVDEFGSPYAPSSVFAGNIDFINKNNSLKNLYNKDFDEKEIKKFYFENKHWLDSYADFMSKSEGFDKNFYIFSQMVFFQSWDRVKKYANDRGISIIGDLPFYVGHISVDTLADKTLFNFDEVAGVPPDYFNKDGQLWGNPLYDFKRMSRNKYKWWINRIQHNLKMFDMVRLDHFRAFDEFYCIPKNETSAKNGHWRKGPGIKFFDELKCAVPDAKIILEDLGEITASVRALAEAIGYPGMRVMQFGFDENAGNLHLPHNYPKNCIAYLGTHDNDTFVGFLRSASKNLREKIDIVLSSYYLDVKDTTRLAFEKLLASNSDTVILNMQDLLFQDSKSRMNTPGTVKGNWQYKLKSSDLTQDLAKYLRMLIERSERV